MKAMWITLFVIGYVVKYVIRCISYLLIFIVFLSGVLSAETSSFKVDGDLIQGGLAYGSVVPGSRVHVNGHQVRVSPRGEFIVGFGRDYPAEARVTVYAADGSMELHVLRVAAREYDVQRIDGLPDDKVTPGKEAMRQIREEVRQVAAARRRDDARMDFADGFIWPVRGPISGVYGSQRILNGQPRRPHFGIDIAAPTGMPVVAPAAGIVSYVNDDMYFSGGTLILDHGHNLSSSFLHLHEILVEEGERVEQGDEIALVGATGRVTGAHLDWRMNWHRQRIDPGLIMDLSMTADETPE